jgi:NifB/MoaA-like Fe-S oxidoreductase
VVQVENDLLGPAVTVSGLLPGRAILRVLSATAPCDAAVLPPDVANIDGLTLDGVKVSGMESRAGMKVLVACHNLKDTLRQLASLLGRN